MNLDNSNRTGTAGISRGFQRFYHLHKCIKRLLIPIIALVTSQSISASPTKTDGQLTQPAMYRNPIIRGFYPDPSICRVGDDYYMVHSTFEYFPGVPVFHSRDLVNWRLIGHCLTRKSQLNLEGRQSSHGIFAPTIRYHNGVFYMITTHVWGGGNFYVYATNPAGPWSDPVWLDREGIDPSLFFDEDGKVYYHRQVGGERGYIGLQLIDIKTGKLIGEMKEIWRGTGGVWPEGPHLYKINGKYYLMISEGGTSYDHCITIARSDSPWGPYEPCPHNPILTHKHLPDHPFQGLGHGDLVEPPDGWWIVFLGFRPVGGRHHHLGRETFLAPLKWNEEGWPVINDNKPIAEVMTARKLPPCPWPKPPNRVEFSDPTLPLEWVFVRNPIEENYSLTERPGFLRLKGASVSLRDIGSPTFVGRRQTAFNCVVRTRVSFTPTADNEEAGLAIRGNERNHAVLVVTRRENQTVVALKIARNGQTAPEKIISVQPGFTELGIRATPLHYEFFLVKPNGGETKLGELLTRDLSTETLSSQPGANFNFTGVVIGLYASGNGKPCSAPADFDWFEYSETGD